MKKLLYSRITVAIILVISVFTSSIFTFAIEPRSLPTISSTACSSCGSSMIYTGDDIDYRYVNILSKSCPNSPDADDGLYHKHNFKDYYKMYVCSACSIWGRLYIKTTMQCEIGMNPYSLTEVE